MSSCLCAHSKAQFQEDCRLEPLLIAAQSSSLGGRFVELGALDGLTHSNTYALETCLNWTGLLIEANPESYAKLQVSGRSATKIHSAVCRHPGRVNVTAHGGGFAGMPSEMSAAYLRSWGRRIPQRKAVVEVPCRSLTSLMQENGLPSGAELLSLDVQGAEELVLRSVDPAVFKVIVVEMDGFDKERERRIHSLILNAGLKQANASFRVQYSRVYTARSL
jgi:FkbM family methyltransferase